MQHQIILMMDETDEVELAWVHPQGQELHQVLKGQHVIFIESGTIHALCRRRESSLICLSLNNRFLKQCSSSTILTGVTVRKCYELAKGDLLIWQLAYILKNLCKHNPPFENPVYVEAVAIILGTHLLRMEKLENYPSSIEPRLMLLQIKKVRAYIHENLTKNITVPQLAHEVGLSKDHFTKLFKNTMGVTPHRYILLKRLQRAQELIAKDEMRLVDIALATGFCDQSHLSRYFRKFCSELARENADFWDR